MKLEGEHTFPVSRAELWNALLDPDLLARVLPGAEPLESTGENSYRTGMTVAIGPVKGRFQGNLVLTDLVPPSSYQMKIDGSGPAGFLRGSGGIELLEAGGGTILRYAMDAQVGGKMASVGQRLIESSGRAIAKQGLDGLERELALRTARLAQLAQATQAVASESTPSEAGGPSIASAATPAPPPAAPSQAAFAGRVARGIWAELPATWKVGILLIASAVLFGIVFALRSC